ncbi:MAG: hypothetical protein AAB019_06005, partial [Planctomycetota bacterium]
YFQIDANGDLIRITYPDGSSEQFSYNTTGLSGSGGHLMTGRADQTGQPYQYEFDRFGKVAAITTPHHDEAGNRERKTYSLEITQAIINNLPAGLGTETNPAPAVLADTLQSTITNARGYRAIIKTNALGQTIQQTDGLNRTTVIQRNANGLMTSLSTQGHPLITNLTYDPSGNLLIHESYLGGGIPSLKTTFTYEANFNQITSITDPNGNRTGINYDAKGNPVEITDALNNKTTITYHERGLPLTILDAKGNTTTFSYQPITGNLLLITDPLGNVTRLAYDPAGNVINTTDAEGRLTQFNYNQINRLTAVIDALNQTTRYDYNPRGDLTNVTDARGNTTTFEYTEIGLLKKTANALGQVKQLFYDLNRNLVKSKDAKGQVITLEYDPADRLIKKEAGGLVTTYTYNIVDNLQRVMNKEGWLDFNYDSFNRLVNADSYIGQFPYPQWSYRYPQYGYDANGNRVSMTDPTGTTYYGWDALNRIAAITNPKGQRVEFAYDELSRRTLLKYPNGVETSYAYDGASQLLEMKHLKGLDILSSYAYTYNKIGLRTSM